MWGGVVDRKVNVWETHFEFVKGDPLHFHSLHETMIQTQPNRKAIQNQIQQSDAVRIMKKMTIIDVQGANEDTIAMETRASPNMLHNSILEIKTTPIVLHFWAPKPI